MRQAKCWLKRRDIELRTTVWDAENAGKPARRMRWTKEIPYRTLSGRKIVCTAADVWKSVPQAQWKKDSFFKPSHCMVM